VTPDKPNTGRLEVVEQALRSATAHNSALAAQVTKQRKVIDAYREGLLDLADRCDGQYPSDIARPLVTRILEEVDALNEPKQEELT
jgi:hypothetical protein